MQDCPGKFGGKYSHIGYCSAQFAFYGVQIGSVQQTMEIIEGLPKIRKALSVPDGVALIMMSSDYKDVNGRAIAFTRSFIRSDKSSFRIKMHG